MVLVLAVDWYSTLLPCPLNFIVRIPNESQQLRGRCWTIFEKLIDKVISILYLLYHKQDKMIVQFQKLENKQDKMIIPFDSSSLDNLGNN